MLGERNDVNELLCMSDVFLFTSKYMISEYLYSLGKIKGDQIFDNIFESFSKAYPFLNITKEEQNEFIVQGQKNNKVGYGIFRVVEGSVVNLFGEGMEEC